MGQGRWIRERDGHYRHYTEEEYMNSPHGIAEKWSRVIVTVLIVVFVALSIIIGIIKGLVIIWQWFIGLF